LLNFGYSEHAARKTLIATNNADFDVLTSYLELHAADEGFNDPPIEEKKKKKHRPRLIPLELQKLFTNMQTLDLRALSTQG
jgi:uncharacterized UBP type Zn finger protein